MSIIFGAGAIIASIPLSISMFWSLADKPIGLLETITFFLSSIPVVVSVSFGIIGNRKNLKRSTFIGYYLAIGSIIIAVCLLFVTIYSFAGFKDI